MKFNTVAEAFNFYRNKSVKELEERAQAINAQIDSDPNADIEAFNIELRGIKEARENIDLRSAGQAAGLNLVTGRNLKGEDKKTFEGEDVAATPEYRSAFYKTLMGRKLTDNEQAAFNAVVEKRADAFNDSTDVAALIPTQTLYNTCVAPIFIINSDEPYDTAEDGSVIVKRGTTLMFCDEY